MSVTQTHPLPVPSAAGEKYVELALGGDADAFCELCRAYEVRLWRQAMALCGDPLRAEDLAQETFIEAWKSLRRYDGQCRFFTWLCAILFNCCRAGRRRDRTRERRFQAMPDLSAADEVLEPCADTPAPPDQTVLRRDEAALVHQCIARLPDKHREVVHLRFFVDDSLPGIAAALGCSVGTVKSRLYYAVEKLRQMPELRAAGTSGDFTRGTP